MAFADEWKRITVKVLADTQAVFTGVVADVNSSIAFGSTVTGSPGQPVDEGILRASWGTTWQSPTSALVASGGAAAGYNMQNEDGIARPGGGPYIQRSAVGGRHSVSKTIDGLPRIVEDVTKRLGLGQ